MDAVVLAGQAWLIAVVALLLAVLSFRHILHQGAARRKGDRLNSDWFILSLEATAALAISVFYVLVLLQWMPFQRAAEAIQSGLLVLLVILLLRKIIE